MSLPTDWLTVDVGSLSPADFAELEQRIDSTDYDSLLPDQQVQFLELSRARNARAGFDPSGALEVTVTRGNPPPPVSVPWWLWLLAGAVGGLLFVRSRRRRRRRR